MRMIERVPRLPLAVALAAALGALPAFGCSAATRSDGAVATGEGPAPETGDSAANARRAAASGAMRDDADAADRRRRNTDGLAPPGYGTLEQDAITMFLSTEGLQIKAVPLAEEVIRMTAPDTYRRLHGYKTSREADIRDAARAAGESDWPHTLLVTLFTRDIEAVFQPLDLVVLNQNRLYRPLDIMPVTPGFGRGRLDQQQAQVALYLFPGDIDLDLGLTLRYRSAASDQWDAIRRRLDTERSRVRARAAADGDDE